MNFAAAPVTTEAASSALAELLRLRTGPTLSSGEVTIRDRDPFFSTSYRVGETTAASLAATGIAANDIWEIRTGRRQRIEVSAREAAASLRTGDYTLKRDGEGVYRTIPMPDSMAHMWTVTQPWPTRDGRYFLPHLNLPNLAARVLGVLQCEHNAAGVSGAVARWDSDALEEAIAEARACGGKVRSPAEWLAHPQGALLAARPVVEIERVGDGAPELFRPGDRPLSGVRVLDLTRILAGPMSGRTMAEHGADVLMVTEEHLPQTSDHVRDTSHGKRSCFIDLKSADDRKRFAELVREADVFINGYRPGALASLGFGLKEITALRPGIVHLSVSCFGAGGPFGMRAGWEQVAQAVTGVCHTHGEATGAGEPKLVPAPMCERHGYLAAYGVMLALARRAHEGGTWAVGPRSADGQCAVRRHRGLLDSSKEAPAN